MCPVTGRANPQTIFKPVSNLAERCLVDHFDFSSYGVLQVQVIQIFMMSSKHSFFQGTPQPEVTWAKVVEPRGPSNVSPKRDQLTREHLTQDCQDRIFEYY